MRAVERISDVERLMRACALRIGNLINQTDLSRDVQIPTTTVHDYLNLLELSYQIVRLEAYATNRTKRLIKTPKLYWNDSALALRLGGGQPTGAHLENFVFSDLLAWRDTQQDRVDLTYWRTTTGKEVDFVIERGDELVGVEVKTSARPSPRDADGLQLFKEEYGPRVRGGLLLHGGNDVFWMRENVLAIPWWLVI